MLPAGARPRITAAVSGGPDSVYLLWLLRRLFPRADLRALHVNHGLRDEASSDERFVRALCREWAVPLDVEQADVRAEAQRTGRGIEEAGRHLRHQIFARRSREAGRVVFALGHTADDVAETLLFNLARGSGLAGASACRPAVEMKGFRLIRPLTCLSKKEVLQELAARGIPWREDASNRDLSMTRNRIRHEILPRLRDRVNPQASRHLAQFALQLAAFESEPTPHAPPCTATDQGLSYLDLSLLRTLPRTRRAERLGQALREICAASPSFRDLVELDLLAVRGRSGKAYSLAGGWTAVKERERLYLLRAWPAYAEEPIPLPGRRRLDAWPYAVETALIAEPPAPFSGDDVCAGRWTVYVDANRVTGALKMTSPRRGDRFIPAGLNQEKKLKDFFSDQGVGKVTRRLYPILRDDEKILWVFPWRLDARAAAPEGGGRCLKVEVTPLG